MKSKGFCKKEVKSEKLPQEQTNLFSGKRNENGNISNVTKPTKEDKFINKSETNSNKISIYKQSRTAERNISENCIIRRYSKNDIDKIIKLQSWWRSIIAILKMYKLKKLLQISKNTYRVKIPKEFQDKYNPNISFYISNNQINTYRKTTNTKRKLIPNSNINSSSWSYNFIQNNSKRSKDITFSTLEKPKYIIETKKVEAIRKPKNNSKNKLVKKTRYISNYEVKQLMKDIWNNETFCYAVESLFF